YQDPAVIQHTTSNQYATLDVYNPFDNTRGRKGWSIMGKSKTDQWGGALWITVETVLSKFLPEFEGNRFLQQSTAAATADLLRRQEELERKAAELDRRERELQNAALGGAASRSNLGSIFPCTPPSLSFLSLLPSFFLSFAQMLVPYGGKSCIFYFYFFGMCFPLVCGVTLFLNFLACLAWFCVDTGGGYGFGLSILWALLFTPCSFVCWYRPLYKAFRSDSSFNFFLFFFIFFVQDVVFVLQAIGIPSWGFSGWIAALSVLKVNVAVAIIMMVAAAFFTALAVLGVVMLKRIHSMYRRTGASFQKAQEEFAAGVFSNQAVRTATANVAASAATGAAQGAFQGH
uniref:Secretory carrier-associated membrane protein n=1 Tax=Latimeria chalumnae TaxID=7897 RepID=H3A5J2_LATCH